MWVVKLDNHGQKSIPKGEFSLTLSGIASSILTSPKNQLPKPILHKPG